MAKTKLFEAWSFRLQQPAPFDDPKYAGSKSMGFSQYNTSSTAQKSTLHAPTMRALLAYAKLVSATENGQSVDGLGAIGHQGTTYRISEYRSANKTDCVVFNPVTGKFNAAQVEDGTQALKPYSVGAPVRASCSASCPSSTRMTSSGRSSRSLSPSLRVAGQIWMRHSNAH